MILELDHNQGFRLFSVLVIKHVLGAVTIGNFLLQQNFSHCETTLLATCLSFDDHMGL